MWGALAIACVTGLIGRHYVCRLNVVQLNSDMSFENAVIREYLGIHYGRYGFYPETLTRTVPRKNGPYCLRYFGVFEYEPSEDCSGYVTRWRAVGGAVWCEEAHKGTIVRRWVVEESAEPAGIEP